MSRGRFFKKITGVLLAQKNEAKQLLYRSTCKSSTNKQEVSAWLRAAVKDFPQILQRLRTIAIPVRPQRCHTLKK